MSKEAMKLTLEQRITDYLSAGGLFNPELADHVAVRDLLIDCRTALAEQPAQSTVDKSELETVPAKGGLLPAQQEPVAFITPLMEQQMFDDWCPYKGNPDPRVVWAAAVDAVNGLLLGAAPQAQTAREWVGLTAEELDLVWDSVPEIQFWWRHYGQAIEAKLREKNV